MGTQHGGCSKAAWCHKFLKGKTIFTVFSLYIIEHILATTSGKILRHGKWDLTSKSFCTRPWAPSMWTATSSETPKFSESDTPPPVLEILWRHPQTYSKTPATTLLTHLGVNSLIKLISVIEINGKKKIDHSAGSHRGRSVFPEKHRQLVSRWRKPSADWWPKHYLGSLSNFVILELNLGAVVSQSSANPIRQVLTVAQSGRGRRQKKKGKEHWVNI